MTVDQRPSRALITNNADVPDRAGITSEPGEYPLEALVDHGRMNDDAADARRRHYALYGGHHPGERRQGIEWTQCTVTTVHRGCCLMASSAVYGCDRALCPFNPLPAFAWMVPAIQRVMTTPGIRGVVVHPAMVYEGLEGVFARFARDARSIGHVRVVGDERTRWPLVYRHDLATLYALALEGSMPGQSYNAATVTGLAVAPSLGDCTALRRSRDTSPTRRR